MTQAYDIIPDIHADADRLTKTLAYLGYLERDEVWAHQDRNIPHHALIWSVSEVCVVICGHIRFNPAFSVAG